MRYLLLILLLAQFAAAADKTFEQITSAFPLGTTKEEILKAEPTALVAPSMAIPLDPSAQKESIILVSGLGEISRLVCQFHLINNRLAAMMVARTSMPGRAADARELNDISAKKKLSTFEALRAGPNLEPLTIQVERYDFGKPNQVALVAASPLGLELWIIDEIVFDPKSFFMPPTDQNRMKLLQAKERIDQQRKQYAEPPK